MVLNGLKGFLIDYPLNLLEFNERVNELFCNDKVSKKIDLLR